MKETRALAGIISALCIQCSVAGEYSQQAIFTQNYPLDVTAEPFSFEPVHMAEIKFPFGFSSISQICYESEYSGNLLQQDESYIIWQGPFFNSGFGQDGGGELGLDRSVTCISFGEDIEEFLDGSNTIGYVVTNGDGATLSNLRVTITGEIDETSITFATHGVSISIDEGQENIPAEGGTLQYYGKIENQDFDLAYKTLTRWSVLTLPTGENYPIHKSSTFDVDAGVVREFNTVRLTIPEWFPAGEYSFTWYIADTQKANGEIVSDTFTFRKDG